MILRGLWGLVLCLAALLALGARSVKTATEATVNGDGNSGGDQIGDANCPVCIRVIRAARALGKSGQEGATSVLNSYCQLSQQLEVEDAKFCYNIENVRGELNRMLNLGADEYRICKRVKAMNSDFCKVMGKKVNKEGIHKNDRLVRGVYYE